MTKNKKKNKNVKPTHNNNKAYIKRQVWREQDAHDPHSTQPKHSKQSAKNKWMSSICVCLSLCACARMLNIDMYIVCSMHNGCTSNQMRELSHRCTIQTIANGMVDGIKKRVFTVADDDMSVCVWNVISCVVTSLSACPLAALRMSHGIRQTPPPFYLTFVDKFLQRCY